MALFTGGDAELPLLTQFYQIVLDATDPLGGDAFEFNQAVIGNVIAASDIRMARIDNLTARDPEGIRRLIECQNVVRRVMEDVVDYDKVNLGDVRLIDAAIQRNPARLTFFPIDEQGQELPPDRYETFRPGIVKAVYGDYQYVPMKRILFGPDGGGLPFQSIEFAMWYEIARALAGRTTFRRCVVCRSVFVAGRSDARYCSHRDAARVSMRKSRAADRMAKK